MTDVPDQFAIVPLPKDPGPLRTIITADAVMTGDMKSVMANIMDSDAQRDLRLTQFRVDSFLRAEEEIQARKDAEQAKAIRKFCNAVDDMTGRFDRYTKRERLRQQLAAEKQAMADMLAIPADLKDPDPGGQKKPPVEDAEAVFPAQEGDYPQPNLYPSLREADGRIPDSERREPPNLREALAEADDQAMPGEPEPEPAVPSADLPSDLPTVNLG
jgi:hypothetical protein